MKGERRERGEEGDRQTSYYIYEEIGPLWVQSSSVRDISHNPLLQSYWMCLKHPLQGNAGLQ